MAQWVTRQRTDRAVSVQIKWRMDGRWQSETFTDLRLTAEFRTAVEAADHRWPQGWVKGEGWKPPEPEPETVTFAQVAHGEKGYFVLQARRAKLPPSRTPRSPRRNRPDSRAPPWPARCPPAGLDCLVRPLHG